MSYTNYLDNLLNQVLCKKIFKIFKYSKFSTAILMLKFSNFLQLYICSIIVNIVMIQSIQYHILSISIPRKISKTVLININLVWPKNSSGATFLTIIENGQQISRYLDLDISNTIYYNTWIFQFFLPMSKFDSTKLQFWKNELKSTVLYQGCSEEDFYVAGSGPLVDRVQRDELIDAVHTILSGFPAL